MDEWNRNDEQKRRSMDRMNRTAEGTYIGPDETAEEEKQENELYREPKKNTPKEMPQELEDNIQEMAKMVTDLLLEDGTDWKKLDHFARSYQDTVQKYQWEIINEKTPADYMYAIFQSGYHVMDAKQQAQFVSRVADVSQIVANLVTDGAPREEPVKHADYWMDPVDQVEDVYAVKSSLVDQLNVPALANGLKLLQKEVSASDPFWMMTNSNEFRKMKSTLSDARKAVEAYDKLTQQMRQSASPSAEMKEQRQKLQDAMLQKLEALADASEIYRQKKAAQPTHNNRDRIRQTIAGKLAAISGAFVVNARVKAAATQSLSAKAEDTPGLADAFVEAAAAVDKFSQQPCSRDMLALAYSNSVSKFGEPLAKHIQSKLEEAAAPGKTGDEKAVEAAEQRKDRIRDQLRSYLSKSETIAKDFKEGKKTAAELRRYLDQDKKSRGGKSI